MIGLECESGEIDDCNLSLTMEVNPDSCQGKLIFSSNSEQECGSNCDLKTKRNIFKRPERSGWTKYVSLDTPLGSGDHENDRDKEDLNPCDIDGTCYKNCTRKSIHIREIATQMPWYGLRKNTLIFSDQTKRLPKFYKSLAEMDDALKSINFIRTVNSTYGVHCFNDLVTGNCLDMEISYFFECLTRLPKSEKTLKCIAIEIRRASFSFSESFHEDYEDTKSEKSKELWNKIEPILKQSFGAIEVDLALVQIIQTVAPAAVPATVIVEENEQESIETEVDILPIRNTANPGEKISATDIISLLQNDEWNKNTESLFTDSGMTFLGTKIQEDPITSSAQQTTTEKHSTQSLTTTSNVTSYLSNETSQTTRLSSTSSMITSSGKLTSVTTNTSNTTMSVKKPIMTTISDKISQLDKTTTKTTSATSEHTTTAIATNLSVSSVPTTMTTAMTTDTFKTIFIPSTTTSYKTHTTSDRTSASMRSTTNQSKTTLEQTSTSIAASLSVTTTTALMTTMTPVISASDTTTASETTTRVINDESLTTSSMKSTKNQSKTTLEQTSTSIAASLLVTTTTAMITTMTPVTSTSDTTSATQTTTPPSTSTLLNTSRPEKISTREILDESITTLSMKSTTNLLKTTLEQTSTSISASLSVTTTTVMMTTMTPVTSTVDTTTAPETTTRVINDGSLTTLPMKSTTNLSTFTSDTTRAEFEFGESSNIIFHQDNNDFQSLKSIELWNNVKPSLEISFGYIAVDLSMTHMQLRYNETEIEVKRSVLIEVDIKIIGNKINPAYEISTKDIISLLNNDEQSCAKFIGFNKTDKNDTGCWVKNIQNIFSDIGIQFLGVILLDFASITSPTSTSSVTTSVQTSVSDASIVPLESTSNWFATTLERTSTSITTASSAAISFTTFVSTITSDETKASTDSPISLLGSTSTSDSKSASETSTIYNRIFSTTKEKSEISTITTMANWTTNSYSTPIDKTIRSGTTTTPMNMMLSTTPADTTSTLETTTPPLSFTTNAAFEDYTSKPAQTATTGVPYSNPPPLYLVSPPPRPLCMVCFLKLPKKNPPPFFPGPPPPRPPCTDCLRPVLWKNSLSTAQTATTRVPYNNPPPLHLVPPPPRPSCMFCLLKLPEKNPPPLFPGPPPSRPPCTDCLRPASWKNHQWL